MINPERLVFERVGITEEICVTPHSEEMDELRAVGVPRERDIAHVLAGVSHEWFEVFLRALQKISPNRAMVVAHVVESAQLKPDLGHERALSNLAAAFGVSQEDLVGAVTGAGWQLLPAARAVLALSTDVTGGDCDPGFGVDPEDSKRLLELLNAIDENFGWASQADQERGDYLARVNEVGTKLYKLVNPPPGAADAHIERLEKQIRTQRAELRRFNREARARKEGNVPLHVSQDRWLQKLHALEQKTALGTANQADLLAIERLKRWLKDYP